MAALENTDILTTDLGKHINHVHITINKTSSRGDSCTLEISDEKTIPHVTIKMNFVLGLPNIPFRSETLISLQQFSGISCHQMVEFTIENHVIGLDDVLGTWFDCHCLLF